MEWDYWDGMYILTVCAVGVILLLLGAFLGKKSRLVLMKKVPFECGFDMMKTVRMPFSVQFYHMGLLFLIFDCELILMSPLVFDLSSKITGLKWGSMFYVVCFLVILLAGLAHEYREGSLEWKK